VRKVVNKSVKTSANVAKNHPHASSPTPRTGSQTSGRERAQASAARKNVPITKTVMNVDSFVANESASSPPISAGWYFRGRSRKRNTTTISASVMHAM
jgi:hypothetical protein